MEDALSVVVACLGTQSPSMESDFYTMGWDSYDLLTLRASFDEEGFFVDETKWIKAKNLSDLLKSVTKKVSTSNKLLHEQTTDLFHRHYKMNMPQMAQGGLSESWLMKEAGDMHWRGIAKGLNTASDAITDTREERLYATFVRIRWQADVALSEYQENDDVDLRLKLSRWGKGFYSGFVDIISSQSKSLGVEMLTSFVSREGGNEGLQKGEPTQAPDTWVDTLSEIPAFMNECRSIRKNEAAVHQTLGFDYPLQNETPVFQWERALNPFTDLNGVNLLYFAAYPPILDTGEWMYAKDLDLGLDTSLVGRDIFYFANCSPGDSMVYKLVHWEISQGHTYSCADLYRKSDKTRMCRVFSKRKILDQEKVWQ